MNFIFLALFILVVIAFFALFRKSSEEPTSNNYKNKSDDTFNLTLDGVDVNARLSELSKLPGALVIPNMRRVSIFFWIQKLQDYPKNVMPILWISTTGHTLLRLHGF